MNQYEKDYKIIQKITEGYHIVLDIQSNKIILSGKSLNPSYPNTYINLFSLSDLKQLSPIFNQCSNIFQAYKLINNEILQNKIIIKNHVSHLDICLFSKGYNTPIPINLQNSTKQIPITLKLSPNNNYKYILDSEKSITININNNCSCRSPVKDELYKSQVSEDYNSIRTRPLTTRVTKINPDADLIKRIKELENENKILKNENKNLRNENINLRNENNNLKNEIDDLRDENNNLKEEIYNIKSENEYLQNELNELQENNNSLKITINKLKNKKNSITISDSKLCAIKGEILKNSEDKEFLFERICKNAKRINLQLIFKATVDAKDNNFAEAFHRLCDHKNNTLVLIETDDGLRFGGFTTCKWEGNTQKYDDNAFVFSLDNRKIYNVISGEKAIQCNPNRGPIFLGPQIYIKDNAFEEGGSTCESQRNYETEENFELNGGNQNFNIREIEVYSVEFMDSNNIY